MKTENEFKLVETIDPNPGRFGDRMIRTLDFCDLPHLLRVAEVDSPQWAEKGHYSKGDGDAQWRGTNTWSEAMQLVRTGWPEGFAKANALRGNLVASVSGSRAMKPKLRRDIAGFMPCVPAVLAGEPDSMYSIKLNEAENRGRIIRIVYNVCVSAGIDAETMTLRGALALALIDLLEGCGFRCEVILAIGDSFGGFRNQIFVPLKNSDQNPEMDSLAFWIAHPAGLRRIIFAILENCFPDLPYSYGSPTEVCKDRQGDIYCNEAYLGDVNNETAVPFLKSQLQKFGVEIS